MGRPDDKQKLKEDEFDLGPQTVKDLDVDESSAEDVQGGYRHTAKLAIAIPTSAATRVESAVRLGGVG